MLTLKEFTEIQETVGYILANPEFNIEEIYDNVEGYIIQFDQDTMETVVQLMSAQSELVRELRFEDSIMASAFLEHWFDTDKEIDIS